MEKEIARFNKNATEEVVVRILEYYGIECVDIRIFVRPIIPKDELKPTRKGICVRKELIHVLVKALERVEEEHIKPNQNEKE